MGSTKIQVAVVAGGYSGEAEVSVKSAAMIMKHIDRERFEAHLVMITNQGWYAETPGGRSAIDKNNFSYSYEGRRTVPQVAFIIIHGTPGEDGKLQGYFDLLGIPYTSGGVMNTSVTFNKIFTTRLLRRLGFNVANGVLLESLEELQPDVLAAELGFPMFVKPNEGGSSLGVSKVKEAAELPAAIALALSKGSAALVESFLTGVEYSCGVLGTAAGPRALHITEIATRKEYFDYKAKYEYDQTEEITPARLPPALYEHCQRMSERIFKFFHCRGVARVDYKLVDGQFYVIEINTVPGMTEHSLVPQQAQAMGIDKTQLITFMLEAALPETSVR